MTLNSSGAVSTASVAGGPYAIVASNATGGSFNSGNYAIVYVYGTLTVRPIPASGPSIGDHLAQIIAIEQQADSLNNLYLVIRRPRTAQASRAAYPWLPAEASPAAGYENASALGDTSTPPPWAIRCARSRTRNGNKECDF